MKRSHDDYAVANLRGTFNFLLARGCVRSIQENLSRLKSEIRELEERLSCSSGELVSLTAPPVGKGVELVVLKNLGRVV